MFGIIIIYLLFSKMKKPYILQKFNDLDEESNFLVIITLYFLFVGSLSENFNIGIVMSVIIAFLNGKFVLKML